MSQQFCLKWNNHTTNMLQVFESLLSTEALVDVTLACDGLSLKAHKMVLSACSPFFQSLFLENPCKHPIVIMKDMRYCDLKAIIDFMYRGEVNVSHDQLSALLKTAETLKVKGLAEVTGENKNASGIVQQEIIQQQSAVSTPTPAPLTPTAQRTDTPPLQGKRKRGRPRKRSLSDSNRSDDEGVSSKIKSRDSDIEELSGDASLDATSDIRSGGGPGSSNSQSQVPSQHSSNNVNSFSKSHLSISQDSQVDDTASGDENEFEVEPSKLLEQTLTTDNVPSSSQNSTGHIQLPAVSGLEISRRSMSSTDSLSQALVPVSDSLGSNLQAPDSPQDIKPQILSFDDPPISPVAGPSHSSERSMMMYMDQSGVSSIPGPSNYQDNSALVPHDSQPQVFKSGEEKKLDLINTTASSPYVNLGIDWIKPLIEADGSVKMGINELLRLSCFNTLKKKTCDFSIAQTATDNTEVSYDEHTSNNDVNASTEKSKELIVKNIWNKNRTYLDVVLNSSENKPKPTSFSTNKSISKTNHKKFQSCHKKLTGQTKLKKISPKTIKKVGNRKQSLKQQSCKSNYEEAASNCSNSLNEMISSSKKSKQSSKISKGRSTDSNVSIDFPLFNDITSSVSKTCSIESIEKLQQSDLSHSIHAALAINEVSKESLLTLHKKKMPNKVRRNKRAASKDILFPSLEKLQRSVGADKSETAVPYLNDSLPITLKKRGRPHKNKKKLDDIDSMVNINRSKCNETDSRVTNSCESIKQLEPNQSSNSEFVGSLDNNNFSKKSTSILIENQDPSFHKVQLSENLLPLSKTNNCKFEALSNCSSSSLDNIFFEKLLGVTNNTKITVSSNYNISSEKSQSFLSEEQDKSLQKANKWERDFSNVANKSSSRFHEKLQQSPRANNSKRAVSYNCSNSFDEITASRKTSKQSTKISKVEGTDLNVSNNFPLFNVTKTTSIEPIEKLQQSDLSNSSIHAALPINEVLNESYPTLHNKKMSKKVRKCKSSVSNEITFPSLENFQKSTGIDKSESKVKKRGRACRRKAKKLDCIDSTGNMNCSRFKKSGSIQSNTSCESVKDLQLNQLSDSEFLPPLDLDNFSKKSILNEKQDNSFHKAQLFENLHPLPKSNNCALKTLSNCSSSLDNTCSEKLSSVTNNPIIAVSANYDNFSEESQFVLNENQDQSPKEANKYGYDFDKVLEKSSSQFSEKLQQSPVADNSESADSYNYSNTLVGMCTTSDPLSAKSKEENVNLSSRMEASTSPGLFSNVEKNSDFETRGMLQDSDLLSNYSIRESPIYHGNVWDDSLSMSPGKQEKISRTIENESDISNSFPTIDLFQFQQLDANSPSGLYDE